MFWPGSFRCRSLLSTFFGMAVVFFACSAAADTRLAPIVANDNRAPAGKLEAGVLTLNLELREGLWRPDAASSDGGLNVETYAFAEAGKQLQTPGPLIRVPQDTDVHITLHNLLPIRVYVHGLNQHPGNIGHAIGLAPGETREVHFNAGEPGSYIYWATIKQTADLETRQDDEGSMSGAFIVDPPGAVTNDRIFVIQLWARNPFTANFEGVLTLNGASWPATERLKARVGEPEHWRVLNATRMPHPMHLHGFYFNVDAVGNGESEQVYTEDERRLVVTETVIGGHTFDMTWTPERAGNWLFHCHIMDHMSNALAPNLFGPDGPPASFRHAYMDHGGDGMGMAKLVLGITVTDDRPHITPVKEVEPTSERHLIVRERRAKEYVPAGPGFYLEGVSHEVEAIGPPLVITQGERTAIRVTNELKEPTAIHWHGIEIESYYDGIAGWTGTTAHTTPPIAPGSSFVAYMTPPRAGTFIYHTHWHAIDQLTGGMYGALLVLPPGEKYDPATDKVFILGRGGANDFVDPLVLNGSPQPPILFLIVGQKYRLRLINITPNDAAVGLSLTKDGAPVKWRSIAKDGADLPPPQVSEQSAVQLFSVGETYDYEFTPTKVGPYELRFCALTGKEVTQAIIAVPPGAPVSVFAKK